MITPQLSARLSANGLECVLRADAIRYDTLVQLAQAWAEPGGRADIEDALDHLAHVLASPRAAEGEVDAAVQAVEDAACMDEPETRTDRRTAARLRRGIGAVIARLAPGPLPVVVRRRDGRDAA